MNWLQTAPALLLALGLFGFYSLMSFGPKSPNRIRVNGGRFRMPDLNFAPTPDTLYRTFEQAGDNLPLMRRYWLLDFGLIVCLWGLMLIIGANAARYHSATDMLARLVGDSQTADGTRATLVVLMVIVATVRALLDIAENSLLLVLCHAYPARKNGLARVACTATTAKFVFLFLWLALFVVTLVAVRL